jgi:tRNA modification GTPase
VNAAGGADLLDTIVAIATPPGVGAIAVLRLSGPRAFEFEAALHSGDPPSPRVATLRALRDASGRLLDRALVTRFPAPTSYTGEDVVEISTHGGAVAPHLVLEALVSLGARQARAGEFTQRAWLNGRLDLVQAEAVADLVEGRSRALHDVALRQLDRGLSGRIAELRERIVALEARLAHHVDFPEEDDLPVSIPELMREGEGVAEAFDRLAETAPAGRVLREGARVVLAGRPNAGKSSLLNALVGEDRAIVAPTAGTTRDRIEVWAELDGIPFLFIDTAGLRDSGDDVEREGVARAKSALERADVVLHCVPADAARGHSDEPLPEVCPDRIVRVTTMADLAERRAIRDVGDAAEAAADRGVAVRVSALEGTGLDELRAAMVDSVFDRGILRGDDRPLLTRPRQVEGVRRAAREMRDFAGGLGRGIPPEAASAHLKEAATATEELLGTIGTEDVLDRVFSDFCVGK